MPALDALPPAFTAIRCPCLNELAELDRVPPFSPFNTEAYANACVSIGDQAFMLGVRGDAGLLAGCIALLRRGRISRCVTIPSLPRLDAPDVFFDGLLGFCRGHRVLDLDIGTFGSENGVIIPALGQERQRRRRWEFVLDLSVADGMTGLSTNHRRSMARAAKMGMMWHRSREEQDAVSHLSAVAASLERRRARGERVVAPGSIHEVLALTRAGAGEVFQSVLDDRVLSSILVLTSRAVAYYHSAGTSAEGTRTGSSAFLIGAAARELRADGIAEFNLGGAEPENAGLFRFKSSFGGTVRSLETASFSLPFGLLLKLQASARRAVHEPGALVAKLVGPSRIPPSTGPAGLHQ